MEVFALIRESTFRGGFTVILARDLTEGGNFDRGTHGLDNRKFKMCLCNENATFYMDTSIFVQKILFGGTGF